VTHLKREICLELKQARRNAGLSQSVVAAEVGCKQSALSMFEQGDPTKLNDEVVEKLAKKFNVSLDAPKTQVTLSTAASLLTAQPHTGFCPNPACPGNHRYQVEDRELFRIDREAVDPVGGKYCALCGELLERRCPNCGALVHAGAICSVCGEPYISSAKG